jgi:hypothetical protein
LVLTELQKQKLPPFISVHQPIVPSLQFFFIPSQSPSILTSHEQILFLTLQLKFVLREAALLGGDQMAPIAKITTPTAISFLI